MQKRTKIIIGIIIAVIIILFLIFVYPGKLISIDGNATFRPATCSDSDGGRDYFVNGTVTAKNLGITKKYRDVCINSTTLNERYCVIRKSDSIPDNKIYFCSNGCSGGKCRNITIDYEDSPFGLFAPMLFHDYQQYEFGDAEAILDLGSYWLVIMTQDYEKFSNIEQKISILPSIAANKNFVDGSGGFIKPSEFDSYISDLLDLYPGTNYWAMVSESDGSADTAIPPQRLAIYHRLSYRVLKDINPRIKFYSSGTWGSPASYYYSAYNSETKEGYYKVFFEELEYMESVEQQIKKNGGTYLDYYDGRYRDYNYSAKDLEVIFRPDNYSQYMDGHQFSKFFVDFSGKRSFKSEWEALLNSMKLLLSKYDYEDIDLWLTQTGMQSAPFSWHVGGGKEPNIDNNFSESKQAQSVIRIYSLLLKDGIKKIFWVTTYEMVWENNPDHYFSKVGLKYNGLKDKKLGIDLDDLGYGVKKLAYYSYKLMVEKLEGSDWKNVQEVYNNSNVYAYKFTKKSDGSLVYVVWWDYWNSPSETTKQVSIPVSFSGTAKITQSVPHFENGLLLQNSGQIYPNFFDVVVNKRVSSGGQVSFTLGQNPVYVEKA